jgi:hypothetical protein
MAEPYECCYIAGRCSHQACGDHWDGLDHDEPPQPTVEEYCAGGGHAYAGDDGDRGRCYCGQRQYPLENDGSPDA